MRLRHPRLRAGCALAWIILLLAPALSAAQPAELRSTLQGSQQVVSKLRAQVDDLEQRLSKAKDESKQADTALLNSNTTDGAALSQLAAAATLAHNLVKDLKAAHTKAEKHLESASQLMRDTAHGLAMCLVRQVSCDAQMAHGKLQDARLLVDLPAQPFALGKVPSVEAIEALLLEAAQAQDAVDKLRAKAAKAYDQGDLATAAVLTTKPATTPGVKAAALQGSATEWTAQALTHPRQARREVAQAQTAADLWVRQSIELQACETAATPNPKQPHCQQLQFEAASQAKLAFEQAKATAMATLKALDTAQYGLETRKLDPDASPQAINNAIELRKLLQSNPDVKSFFGADGIALSASAAGANAVIRKTWGDNTLTGNNRFSFIASTPKSGSGLSGFVDEADQLKNKTSLALAWSRTRSETRLISNAIVDYSLGLTWARDERSYLEATTPLSLVEHKATFDDWAVNSQLAALLPGQNNLLLLNASKQRVRKDGPSATRCPVDPLLGPSLATCTTGPLGMPKRAYDTVFSLEYRSVFDNFGLGFKATHSRRDDKLTLDMPVYFIRDQGHEKTPLTGGINLSWTKDGTGLKVGIFIAAPLGLSRPER